MLIAIKQNKICDRIRSHWPFENLRRPGHLSHLLQSGLAYLAEILCGVYVGP